MWEEMCGLGGKMVAGLVFPAGKGHGTSLIVKPLDQNICHIEAHGIHHFIDAHPIQFVSQNAFPSITFM